MVKSEDILRLIVIDDSSNHAETVSSLLRNAGQAVRTERAEDDEDLRELLAQQGWDMVLTKADIPHLNPIDAMHIIHQTELEIPLIVLLEAFDDSGMGDVLDAGARAVVSLEHPVTLVHTLAREFGDVLKRRRHRECETLLQEANRRAQSLVDSSRDAIAYVHEGMYIYANESYLQMFGYSSLEEIEGMPLMDMVSPADHGKFKEFLRGYLKGRTAGDSLDIHGCKADGDEFMSTMDFSPASYEGESCIQIIIRDQSLSKELEAKLDSLTKHDLLTGAYNRPYFMAMLQNLVGQSGVHGTLLYVAPDDFKSLRERLGIAGSDLLLTDFATLLKQHLPGENDLVARFDGEVFTLILQGVEEDDAAAIAKKILQAIEENIFDANGQTASLTGSIGIALYHEDLHDMHELLQRAEKAYRKASAGGNRLYLYNPQTEGMAEREQASLRVKQLKTALRDNRFQLLFQPIVSLHGDPVENYEVLLRLLDDDGKQIPPSEFMPAAEHAGLMGGIDRWVLAHTVKALVERRRAGRNTHFFIKVSGESLHDDKMLPWLRDLLKAAKVEGSYLTLELSEAVASSNLKLIKPLIEGLHQLRIQVGLDHFGLAPNYVNLLRHAEVDYLKIDGNLIRGIAQSKENQARVSEITAMAQESGKKTIAEFVEDANTLSTLWSCGIDYIQGYFLQEPGTEMNYDFNAS
jgi:diguanylate cyclase (GGDEF)-like protein/PAS domain S-box-containing protein